MLSESSIFLTAFEIQILTFFFWTNSLLKLQIHESRFLV